MEHKPASGRQGKSATPTPTKAIGPGPGSCLIGRNNLRGERSVAASSSQKQIRSTLGVIETIESDNIVRWDGERLYVEQDVYHNGQIVHRKYRRTVTEPVARALSAILSAATH